MNKTQLKQIFLNKGWQEDKYGNLRQVSGERVVRLKFQATSCRFESQVKHKATQYSPASKSWVKIGGDYYGKIKDEGEHVIIGKRKFSKA